MTNNSILRRIWYIFDFNDKQNQGQSKNNGVNNGVRSFHATLPTTKPAKVGSEHNCF